MNTSTKKTKEYIPPCVPIMLGLQDGTMKGGGDMLSNWEVRTIISQSLEINGVDVIDQCTSEEDFLLCFRHKGKWVWLKGVYNPIPVVPFKDVLS